MKPSEANHPRYPYEKEEYHTFLKRVYDDRDKLAGGGDERFMFHEFANGIEYYSCSGRAQKVWTSFYMAWRVLTFGIVTFSLIWGWVLCPHYGRIYYFTNWQVWAVWTFFTLALISAALVRAKKHVKDDKFATWILSFGKPMPHILRLTWFFHGLAFTWTTWVFLLYFAGGSSEIVLDSVSILSHIVPTTLMLIDFFISGIVWTLSMTAWCMIFAAVYFMWTVIHFRAGLGHFVMGVPGGCEAEFAASLNSTYTDAGAIFIYMQVDWRKWPTALLVGIAILLATPAYGAFVWWFHNTVVWLERNRRCPSRPVFYGDGDHESSGKSE